MMVESLHLATIRRYYDAWKRADIEFRSLDEVQRNPGVSLQDSRIPLRFIRATPLMQQGK